MLVQYLESITHSDADVAAETDAVRYEPWGKCPVNPQHSTGGRRLTALSVELARQPLDLMTTNGPDWIATDRVRAVFQEHGVTGAEFLPMTARYARNARVKAKHEIPTMWELRVVGWGGIAPPNSGVRRRQDQNCTGCGQLRYTGITDAARFVDERQWDGSDIFFVWPSPRRFFISPRLADLIRSHHFTGVETRGLSDLIAFSKGPVNRVGFGPRRLSFYLPPERAQTLGAEHDIV